ncbi:hypothetical protein J1N10_18990 [Carboxylicivirga sp. A043]|uniref:OprO/OprP family phosphate-selective porin n=1 Tax=Carboxylicivirga litoralis TaxID=2816963 RepID=UPI0021CB22F5|nr:porin [Carboxylicivirga sp. A043]MCU4158069.1 hypothetical protein [Carboxylicivirga sp. A043]
MRFICISFLVLLFSGGLSAQNQQKSPEFLQDSILKSEFENKKPWYQFGNEKVSFLPMAVVALDVTYYGQDANSIKQVGDQDNTRETGQIRAVRFGVGGTINLKRQWRFLIAGAYKAFNHGFNPDSTTDFALYDLMLDAHTKYGHIVAGYTKEPISLQRTASLIYLGGVERAMHLDAFFPARNWGLYYYNSFAKEKIFWAAGYFKDLNVLNKYYKWNDANDIYVSRLTANPLYKAGGEKDLHLGIGFRYSDFRHGGSLGQHPEAYNASKYVVIPAIQAEETITFNYELAYRQRNLLLTSEITTVKLHNSELDSPTLNGFYVQADYTLTGESRRYMTRNATFSPIVPAKNVQNGGIGAIELTFRYSELKTNVGNLTGGDMSKYSGFITWYPTLLSKFQFGYSYIRLDRMNLIGHTSLFQMRFAVLIG